jgi:hypothetical protein
MQGENTRKEREEKHMANSRKKEENYILVLKPWLGKIHVLAEP